MENNHKTRPGETTTQRSTQDTRIKQPEGDQR